METIFLQSFLGENFAFGSKKNKRNEIKKSTIIRHSPFPGFNF